jgi:hypothetical protein
MRGSLAGELYRPHVRLAEGLLAAFSSYPDHQRHPPSDAAPLSSHQNGGSVSVRLGTLARWLR